MQDILLFLLHKMSVYLPVILRLVLACILGGAIGYEREHIHRPAGFRTHILVCVGAALIMITSEYIFKKYGGATTLDPARLGAQVISGIGFLGAGTIIVQGVNVRGLTTAASLWTVSCVGIAIGIGFYSGAIFATVLVYITLVSLKNIEKNMQSKRNFCKVIVTASKAMGQINVIRKLFDKNNIIVDYIDLKNEINGEITIEYNLEVSANQNIDNVLKEIVMMDNIINVSQKWNGS